MKKVFKFSALILTIAVIVSCFTGIAAPAAGTSSSSSNDFQIQDGVLMKYNGKGGKVTIPDSITKINSTAFYNCKELTEITIPSTVTQIGDSVFLGCSKLSKINVSNKNEAFCSENGVVLNKDKSKLIMCPPAFPQTTFQVPKTVTGISESAFLGCSGLTNIIISDNVTEVPTISFTGCNKLATISVSTANKYFSSESGILFNKDKSQLLFCPVAFPQKVYLIPNSVTSVGDAAFEYCYKITNLTIPGSVTKIGYAAFAGCTQLSTVTYQSNLTEIGAMAFEGTPWLNNSMGSMVLMNSVLIKYKGTSKNVTIPGGVIKINDYAFASSDVADVTIPLSVQSLGEGAFVNCKNLKSIMVPNTVTQIGNNAIEPNTTIIGYEGSAAQAYAQKNYLIFQPTDISETGSTASDIQSAPSAAPTAADTTAMGISPIKIAAILICAALVAGCILFILKKRKAHNQPVQAPIQTENIANENLPIPPEPFTPFIPLPTEIICGQCGRSCPSEARFCPNCGHEMKK